MKYRYELEKPTPQQVTVSIRRKYEGVWSSYCSFPVYRGSVPSEEWRRTGMGARDVLEPLHQMFERAREAAKKYIEEQEEADRLCRAYNAIPRQGE